MKYNIFEKLYHVTPQYKQWTILTLFNVALWKIPLVLNGLKIRYFYVLFLSEVIGSRPQRLSTRMNMVAGITESGSK